MLAEDFPFAAQEEAWLFKIKTFYAKNPFKMTEKEKGGLREEYELLKELLNIHVQNPDIWKYNEKGFEEYVNAVLDRINEIKEQLNKSSLP